MGNRHDTFTPMKEDQVLESIEAEHKRWTDIIKNTRHYSWGIKYLNSEMTVTIELWRKLQERMGVHQQSKHESTDIESLRKENRKMRDEISSLRSALHSKQGRPSPQGREGYPTAGSPNLDKKEIENLKGRILELKATIASLEDDKQQLMLRLSKIAGDRLMDNNPNIADLSDQNRPTKLAERYNELYDNEWTDAFEALVKAGHGEDDAVETLRLTLMNVFSFCERKSEMMIHNAANVVDVMFEEYRSLTATGHYNEPPSHLTIRRKPRCVSMYPNQVKGDGLPFELQDILLQKRWQHKVAGSNSPSHEKTRMVSKQDDIAKLKEIGEKKLITLRKEIALSMLPLVQQAYIDASWSGDCIPLMKPYIRQCLYVCWMMVVQTPPMAFHATTEAGETFDKRYYREYMATGPSIKYVVWPPMLLHKEGPLVGKGVAQGAHKITDVDGFANIE